MVKNRKNFPKTRDKTMLSALISYVRHILLDILMRTARQEKEIKGTQIGKEDVKLLTFAEDMILYVESSEK